jgi:hypothetical protein
VSRVTSAYAESVERPPETRPETQPVAESDPEQDRDLTDLEALERELAALEHELEIVDGAPGDD